MADKLVSLREPLLSAQYDGWRMLGLARSTNATLALYALAIPSLATCPDATGVVDELALLTTTARRQIAIVQAAGTAVAKGPRQAMVVLYELLPDVVQLSKDAADIADRLSIDYAAAVVPEGALEPLGKLAPLPSPTRAPVASQSPESLTARAIRASFFGAGVKLETYRASGDTPREISDSMNMRGPYSEWIGGRADGMTKTTVSYRFDMAANTNGSCYLYPTGDPAIVLRYTVIVPRWSPPPGTSDVTIEWWNDLVLEIAAHERHHVKIYREAQEDLNSALASSTCENFNPRLAAVWNDVNRDQCEFDMREYGYAVGLSLQDCLAQ